MKNGDLVTCPTQHITGIFYHASYFPRWSHIPVGTWGFIIRVIAPLDEAVAALRIMSPGDFRTLSKQFDGNVAWAFCEDIEPLTAQTKPKRRRGKRHRMRTGGLLGEAVL